MRTLDRVPENPKDSMFLNRVTDILLGMISSTGNMKTVQGIFVQGHYFLFRDQMYVIFWTAKPYIFTVSSTMDELYRMDLILEMQG